MAADQMSRPALDEAPELDQLALLRSDWRRAVAARDQFPLLFYAILFDLAPEVAGLFPPDMREQRRHLVATLGHVVTTAAGSQEAKVLDEHLRQLGRDHRRYGAEAAHYPVVGEALILALSHFSADWGPDHEAAWLAAFTSVANTMASAAAVVEGPPWLDLEVIENASAPALDELVSLVLSPPSEWPVGYGPGRDVWAHRTDRPAHWVRGRLLETSDGRPHLMAVISHDDLATVVLAQCPEGARVRLAPVFDQEADDHE